ncbi:hypothetical protein LX36DRAFT_262564 [Colletotrichum falcatum]|nr:hypothetical protein LX36DRAFT_262564 [Colletotrichum falcatum]
MSIEFVISLSLEVVSSSIWGVWSTHGRVVVTYRLWCALVSLSRASFFSSFSFSVFILLLVFFFFFARQEFTNGCGRRTAMSCRTAIVIRVRLFGLYEVYGILRTYVVMLDFGVSKVIIRLDQLVRRRHQASLLRLLLVHALILRNLMP